MVRAGLRWKILLLIVITPLSLGLAALVTVDRNVKAHVDSSSIHESLEHSVRVFESMLAARGRALAGGAEVIARDPRFFSLLTLGAGQRDSRFIVTVRGMAKDFNQITQAELFEVLDRRGRPLASVGAVRSVAEARDPLVAPALRGKSTVGIMVLGHSHYQVSTTPVRADGRIVGVLLLGSEIGNRLARVLRAQMRSEVTFVSGHTITGTTLHRVADRAALLERLASLPPGDRTDFRRLGVLKVVSSGMTFATVIQRIPSSDPSARQLYVMQRAFDPEILFLHKMQRDMLMLALVALAAAVLSGLLLSEKLTRPLLKLVRAAQEMQRGNYGHPVDVHGADEIGYLAERFNEMRQRQQLYVNSLEEAARVKSEFITVASHELRTPLSVIIGYRDLLEGGTLGPLNLGQQEAVDAIGSSLLDLTRIAEQATQVAQVKGKRIEPNPVEQPLGPILARAIGSAAAAAPTRRVRVESRADEAPEAFPVDGDLLSQAVTHLVSNGIRFTPDEGRVRVEARTIDGDLEILVLDGGPGIPGDRLGRIFDHAYAIDDPHHQSSAERGFKSRGLGLGLGIARGIVEAHGGTIGASNRPEGGAEFRIRIPRARAKQERDAA